MERVNHLLQRLLGNQRFKQRYEQMKRYILEHPDVQPFLRAHERQLSADAVDRSLMKLYEFIEQHGNCRQCPGLERCNNMLPGYHQIWWSTVEGSTLSTTAAPKKCSMTSENGKSRSFKACSCRAKSCVLRSLTSISMTMGGSKRSDLPSGLWRNTSQGKK